MKNLLLLIFLMSTTLAFTQVNYSANDQVAPYTGVFRPGINFDYYPPYTSQELANIAAGNPALGLSGIGAATSRPSLRESFAEVWGYDFLEAPFAHFKNLGMEDLTMIVGFPAEWHQDWNDYCDASDPMHIFCKNDFYTANCGNTMFGNLYTPIWDGGLNGTPYNDDNYLAAYMYKLVTNYKGDVKFWEIWNEPGFDHSYVQGWQPPGGPNNWWDNDPSPCVNHFKAPIEHFVRTLRISYDVIKTVDPDAYVTLAGVGFESFLDAVLRNTDNPEDGSVTAEYPLGGGAYFDVMGFHTYPDIDGSVREWVTGTGWVYHRNSDAGAKGVLKRKTTYANRLAMYGYDGVTFPKKEWIITEINVPRVKFGDQSMASEELQVNYITKAVVQAMKLDIRQMHPYQLADRKTVANAEGEFDLLGMYYNFTGNTPYDGLTKTKEGIAYKTTNDVIFGTRYDAAKTAAMNLPNNLDGGAFYDAPNNRFKYIIWAKTTQDLSEAASGSYSFPASFGISTIEKREWNFSETNAGQDISPNNITLTGRPIYLIDGDAVFNGVITASCPATIAQVLPAGAITMPITWQAPIASSTCPTSNLVTTTLAQGQASGSSFTAGNHTISYSFTDVCGNVASCSFSVIVTNASNGNISATCPANITETLAAGATTMPITWQAPVATTTCPTSSTVTTSLTQGTASGSNFSAGTQTITYSFTDACNNDASCSFSVTVNPAAGGGDCGQIAGYSLLGEYNGNGYYKSNTSVQYHAALNAATSNGGNLVSINDAAENAFLKDNISETVLIGLNDEVTEGTLVWTNGDPVTYTNYNTACSWCATNDADHDFAVLLHWDGTWAFEGPFIARPYVMEKTCSTGNTSVVTISCRAGMTYSIPSGATGVVVNWVAPQATTTCNNPAVTITQTAGPASGSSLSAGVYTITYTGTDACGSSNSCSFNVTVTGGSTGGGCDPIADFTKLGELNGMGYYISDMPMTWEEGNALSTISGGMMLQVKSKDVNDYLVNLVSEIVFMGFSDHIEEGTVLWSDNTEINYSNFSDCDWCGLNTAENDYGVFLPWNGGWSFNNQWVRRKFIMQKACSGGGGGGTGCGTKAGFTFLGTQNAHSYYMSNDIKNWKEASKDAIAAGGYLASIGTATENDFIQSKLGNDLAFIGFNDEASEGTGAWSNGAAVAIDYSYGNSANNDYAIINFWAGNWQMVNTQVAKKFILEMECSEPIVTPTPTNAPSIQIYEVYPNPANDLISLRLLSEKEGKVNFKVYNLQGQVQFNSKGELTRGANEIDFDISNLQNGVYFLEVSGKRINKNIRFVKMD